MNRVAKPTKDVGPFAQWDHQEDERLCRKAVDGSRPALEKLLRRHQRYLYNVALRLVLSPQDAEELVQETLIRIVTRLHSFEGRSTFRTWAYRVLKNYFLDTAPRRKMEQAIVGFDHYGQELDHLPSQSLRPQFGFSAELPILVEEANIGCMIGMLLCLSREQRITYVLSDIFEASSRVAAEVLEITPAAYRKRLERARNDLLSFMKNKCGLVDSSNPFRCEKKTSAFIQNGWVDPSSLKYTSRRLSQAKSLAPVLAQNWSSAEELAAQLFQQHPKMEGPDVVSKLSETLRALPLTK